jgi:hypothetical protein
MHDGRKALFGVVPSGRKGKAVIKVNDLETTLEGEIMVPAPRLLGGCERPLGIAPDRAGEGTLCAATPQ